MLPPKNVLQSSSTLTRRQPKLSAWKQPAARATTAGHVSIACYVHLLLMHEKRLASEPCCGWVPTTQWHTVHNSRTGFCGCHRCEGSCTPRRVALVAKLNITHATCKQLQAVLTRSQPQWQRAAVHVVEVSGRSHQGTPTVTMSGHTTLRLTPLTEVFAQDEQRRQAGACALRLKRLLTHSFGRHVWYHNCSCAYSSMPGAY